MEAELGCALEQRFVHFAEQGIGASLSQVHRAQTRAGRDVVVKVQYPGMDEAIESDLRRLLGVVAVTRLASRRERLA
jgi:predicted unusual protein kinase regulating ubiquinone biosynthesis (AarF/ABC1/UbiB family)